MASPSWILILSLICTITSSLRVPIPDVREMKRDLEKRASIQDKPAEAELEEVFHQYEKRLICIYDGVLNGLLNDIEDADPWCRSYIGINDVTASKTVVTRTTITNIITTTETNIGPTVTVAGNTQTVTITAAPRALRKRQASGPVTPFAALSAACVDTPLNQTLKSRVSSGCSCLRLTPGTDDVLVTITSTRTLSGLDYQQQTVQVTITTPGTRTVTATVPPPNIPTDTRNQNSLPVETSTIPLSPTTSLDATVTVTSTYYPPGNSTGVTGTGIGSLGTGASSSSLGSYSGSYSQGVDTRTQNPQTETPSYTISTSSNVTSYGTSAASSGAAPISTRPTTTSIVSVVTGVNSTSKGSYTGTYSQGLDTRTQNPQTSTASLSIQTSLNSTYSKPSGTVVPVTNSSSYFSTPTPSTPVCPYPDHYTYSSQCQDFEILCYKNYAGPTFLGLFEKNLNDCIEDCATVNVGFSQDKCYGITFNVSEIAEKNCYFKTAEGVQNPVDNELIVAAHLINNNTCTTSSSGIPFPTYNSTGIPFPTGSLSLGVSSRVGGSVTTSAFASVTLSYSGNTTRVNPTGPPFSIPTGTRNGNTGVTSPYTGNTTSLSAPTIPPFTNPTNTRVFPSGSSDFSIRSSNSTRLLPTSSCGASFITVTQSAPAVTIVTTITVAA